MYLDFEKTLRYARAQRKKNLEMAVYPERNLR